MFYLVYHAKASLYRPLHDQSYLCLYWRFMQLAQVHDKSSDTLVLYFLLT